MPIHLQTGLPGSAKTLRLIGYVKQLAERENRTVYYHGITDLQLSWLPLPDPKKWFELPEGAIIFIDECQDLFPVHETKLASLDYVLQLAKHRHRGYDLFLITQHPMNIHAFVRRLIDKHWHNIRAFGMQASNVHEWNRVIDYPEKTKNDSQKTIYKFSKEAFKYYKSAEVHTIQRKIPKRVFWLLVIPFLLVGFGYVAWTKLSPKHNRDLVLGKNAAQTQQGVNAANQLASNQQQPKLNYIQAHVPLLADFPHTAPAYAEVVKPAQAPYPAACINSKSQGCNCYTQQGTKLIVSASTCIQIVENGFFVEWNQNQSSEAKPLINKQSGVSGLRPDVDHVIPILQDDNLRPSPSGA